jgi:hypothetical protein
MRLINLLAPIFPFLFNALVSLVARLWHAVLHAGLQPYFSGLEVIEIDVAESTA